MSLRPRIYISAAHKSSGKTTLSIGLLAALAENGMAVAPFKKGPDYIDPMWLGRASGRPCFNLDFNTQSVEEINSLFLRKSADTEISIIEGNKGLYDGVDISGSDANAALAKQLGAPVILVLDVTGITRGVAPLVLGYQAFDKEVRIGGVILNKVGGSRVEGKLRAVLEQYTDVPVLGAVGRDVALEVRERHLGLTPPDEAGEVDKIIETLREKVREGVNLEDVISVANSAPEMKVDFLPDGCIYELRKPVRIGVARDAAFGFYYADDFEAFGAQGAELIFFDTLKDAVLPEVDGLFIGGGFPETHMADLAANVDLVENIAKVAHAGMPIYAECGGLMYLTRSIRWGDACHRMVGVLEADCVMHSKPQGRGLVVLENVDSHPWDLGSELVGQSKNIAAHEFHYASLENIDPGLEFAYNVLRGSGIDGAHDGIVWKNILANFCHLRNTSRLNWVSGFVDFVRRHKRNSAG